MIKKQNIKKLLIMGYNIFRVVLIKVIHRNSEISIIQNINPTTEIAISNNGKIKFSRSIFTRRNVSLRADGGILEVGTSFFNQGCTITAMKRIKIGDNCLFGPNVVIVDHDHDYSYLDIHRGNHYLMDEIVIEDNVWIGANVTILRGTYIGSGSVVGAGTIVKGRYEGARKILNKKELTSEEI